MSHDEAAGLLRRYAREQDEEAFRRIVERYFDFVHGVASRRLNGNTAAALDVAQIVFTDLARQAGRLKEDSQLGGFLHRHTCFVASKHIRSEIRRTAHEQEAFEMNSLQQSGDDPWNAIAPVVDEVLEEMLEGDRNAILLRYFEGRNLRSVGEALRLSEDAAQKRVQRAVEKLKGLLEARGVAVSLAILGSSLAANASPTAAERPIDAIISSATRRKLPSSGMYSKLAIVCGVLILSISILVWQKTGTPQATLSTEVIPQDNEKSVIKSQAKSEADETRVGVVASSGLETNAAAAATAASGDELRLQVINRVTKQPIASANVRVSTHPGPTPLTVMVEGDKLMATDANGIVRIGLMQARATRLLLQTYADGFADWISIWEPNKGDTFPTEFTVELVPGVLLGGRVMDVEGKPIAGAGIRLAGRASSAPIERSKQKMEMRLMTNYSDASGAWIAKHVPEGFTDRLSIQVTHPDYAQTFLLSDAQILSLLKDRQWVVTLRKGFNVSGRVTNTNGEPVGDALVAYGRRFASVRREVKADVQGKYELSNLSSEAGPAHGISVSAPGYASASQSIPRDVSPAKIDFVLEAGAVIRGRVVDSGGQPMKGIRVSRDWPQPREDDGIVWDGETDEAGKFEWASAPHSPQSFYFGLPGWAPIRNRILEPREEEHVIVMRKPNTLKGSVRDAVSGESVTNYFVMPATGNTTQLQSWSPSSEKQFKTEAFEISVGESSYNVIRIRASGYFTTTLMIPQENQPLNVQLKPAGTVRGVVRDSTGAPIAGAEVAALGNVPENRVTVGKGKLMSETGLPAKTMTDREGRFTLGLTDVAITLVAAHPSEGFAMKPRPSLEELHDLQLSRWARVEGTLLSNNIPVAGRQMSLNSFSQGIFLDRSVSRVRTDENGRFVFEAVPPVTFILMDWLEGGSQRIPAQTNFTAAPGAMTYIELKVN